MKERSSEKLDVETHEEEEGKMKANLAKTVMDVGAKAAHLSYEVGRVKSVVGDAVSEKIEDGVHAAKRAARRSLYAAEDLRDEATFRIKQKPLRWVGVTLGVGFGVGAIVGFLTSRIGRGRSSKG